MSQLTFAEAEYAIKKRTTRREKFLARLEELIPWQKLKQQLSKGYQKTGPGTLLSHSFSHKASLI